jgi:hypothetical protein
MYQENPQAPAPGPSTTVWRYMNAPTFLSLLVRNQLFFRRISDFKDEPHEGRFPREAIELLAYKVPPRIVKTAERFTSEKVCVNCWHRNRIESMAMWGVYSDEYGIAVRSTVGRLQKALQAERRTVFISNITYETVGPVFPHLYKRKEFEHEHEVRLWCDTPKSEDEGVYISVDLEQLVEGVVSHPKAKPWVVESFESLLNAYGLQRQIEQSDLNAFHRS